MTVKEGLKLLAYGTRYKAISARTAKKLFDYTSSDALKARYADYELTDAPFFAELYTRKDTITHGTDFCMPMIVMWVCENE